MYFNWQSSILPKVLPSGPRMGGGSVLKHPVHSLIPGAEWKEGCPKQWTDMHRNFRWEYCWNEFARKYHWKEFRRFVDDNQSRHGQKNVMIQDYILVRYAQTNIKNLYPNSWCRDKIDNFGVEVYSSINETLQPKMHSTQIIIPQ